jgi:adenosylmethionine-8-amino-7-oxononanoate aminotransferase
VSNLWRPFSVPGVPTLFKTIKGSGACVTDQDGREYLDAAGGLWNVSLGLNNARLIEQMVTQMQNLTFASLFHSSNSPAERLSEKLIALSDGAMQYVYLSTTGSSAVEVALKVARLYYWAKGNSRKKRILSFDSAYHGCSGMGISASGILAAAVTAYEDLLPGFQTIPSPRDEHFSLQTLVAILESEADQVACLIMEPILGSAGVILPSKSYCQEVSRLCAQYDVLLVADEVATGGGRCGSMFASTLLDLSPDIIALSKGINSGYFPLGATLFSSRVVEPINRKNVALQFGSTQDGNPVGCASALATLNFISEHDLERRADELGASIRANLAGNADCPVIKEVRGLGLMIGIELAHLDAGRTAFSAAESAQVRHQCQDAGLLTYHFDSGISLFPALTITDDEAGCMVDILHEIFCTLC